METLTATDEMRRRWKALGEAWLREHPVMEPPAGFALDPEAIGPTWTDRDRDGWFLIGAQPDEDTLYAFADLGPGARALVAAHVDHNPAVVRIELWDGDACIWAAKRS